MKNFTLTRLLSICVISLCCCGSVSAAYINASYAQSYALATRNPPRKPTPFSSVVRLEIDSDFKYASAVMLTPEIGITAASALHEVEKRPITVSRPHASTESIISQWDKHHDYNPFLGLDSEYNLAMFRLSEPLEGLSNVNIIDRGKRRGLKNKKMTYVGYQNGTALTRPDGTDSVLGLDRVGELVAFTNIIDGPMTKTTFSVDYDTPFSRLSSEVKSATGEARVLRHEGTLHEKEFGGAAFIKDHGQWKLAGIGSHADSADSITHPLSENLTSVFTRLSTPKLNRWILARSENIWWNSNVPATPQSLELNDTLTFPSVPPADILPIESQSLDPLNSPVSVPEPSSYLLLLIGSVAIVAVRCRKSTSPQ